MKKILVRLLTFLIIILSACNQENKIKINGQIENESGSKVYIKESFFTSLGYIDSVMIGKNGNFSFNP